MTIKPHKMGIGIAGCGTIAGIHALAIKESASGELVSVFSRNKEKARDLGEKSNVSWTTDWDIFISDPRVELVSVCTPSGTHLDYGRRAAEAGKHVIVEKPIEVTMERAETLIRICRDCGVRLSVIFQNRFIPGVLEMKGLVDRGEPGKIFLGEAIVKWYRTQEYYDSGEWRATMALDGGGVLINQAIHTIDLLQWMMGDVWVISGQTGIFTHTGIEGEDNAVAVLRFMSGALGVIIGSTSIQPASERSIVLHGEKGTLALQGNDFILDIPGKETSVKQKKPGKKVGADSPLAGFSTDPHRHQIEAVVNAIRKGEEPPVTGPEALKALKIVLGIYESAKKNRPVVFG